MMGLAFAALASICTASTFGSSGDQFVIELTRDGAVPHVAVRSNERTSWLTGRVDASRSIVRVFDRDDGSKVLMGDARGGADGKYYSIQLSGDVVGGKAENLSVDVVSYTDDTYRKGYKRIVSADCKSVSGEFSVEGL
ncbi:MULTISPECIES: hypothetical protein [unclassified Sphingobium]|uniref:hypothetical protein n=1 Tax=unclassified Sphingobium TaxID=2611147 RepID=UPI0035A5C71E